MVNRLFEDEFNKRMGGVTELVYGRLKWTDKAVVAVCKVIATGVLKKLEELYLNGNQIGDAGVMALAEAAGHAAAAQGTRPHKQPDWRCRRDGAGGGGGKGTLPQLKELEPQQQPDWRCRRDGAGGGGG